MALTEASLKNKMVSELTSALGEITDTAQLEKVCGALAKAVISEITTNAVITVTSVTGVTTGPGVSGPGTGTIT